MKHSILLSLLVIFLFSCNKDKVDPELIISIDDEFEIDLWEDLSQLNSNFFFLVKTIKNYNCEENTIDYRVNAANNNIVITLEKIAENVDCIAGEAPAKAKIPLGDLKMGTYSISIKLKETIKNEGILKVTPDKFSFSFDNVAGLNLIREELYRVPKGTVWGYIAYQSSNEKAMADAFYEEMNALSTTEKKNYLKGYYGYFSIGENQSIKVNDKEQPLNTKHFIFDFSGDIQDLKKMADDLSINSGGKLAVKLFYFL